ncbi:MAG TPA: hypothetical protein VFR01_07840 [Geobacterales bacterium]|nr:hypothetical protein [Geobacterales bacterium]
MESPSWYEKLQQVLAPFETERIATFVRTMNAKTVMENPWIILVFIVIFFYAVVKRSKFVLLFLFSCITIAILIRLTMPAEGDGLSLKSTLPFAFGALAIGAVIIYFSFIKSE